MELSVRERDRMAVLRQVDEGMLAAATAAARLGVTWRHFRRLMRRFEAEGDGAAVHRLRGRRSNRALVPEVRERVLALAADPLQAGFGPTLLAEHARRRLGVRVSAETVRGWLAAGVWKRRRKRAKHRSRRPRRAALDELVQWDSSVHPWLEVRGPADLVLVSMHDDATSRMQFGRLVKRDTGAENRRAIIACLKRHGRPLAVYADHAGQVQRFGQRRKDGKRMKSVIARGLEALGVELILAGSPQAKGRIERTYGTAQDRLVKEMRVAGSRRSRRRTGSLRSTGFRSGTSTSPWHPPICWTRTARCRRTPISKPCSRTRLCVSWDATSRCAGRTPSGRLGRRRPWRQESGRARGSSSNGVSRASCACATAAGTWRPGRWVPPVPVRVPNGWSAYSALARSA